MKTAVPETKHAVLLRQLRSLVAYMEKAHTEQGMDASRRVTLLRMCEILESNGFTIPED